MWHSFSAFRCSVPSSSPGRGAFARSGHVESRVHCRRHHPPEGDRQGRHGLAETEPAMRDAAAVSLSTEGLIFSFRSPRPRIEIGPARWYSASETDPVGDLVLGGRGHVIEIRTERTRSVVRECRCSAGCSCASSHRDRGDVGGAGDGQI